MYLVRSLLTMLSDAGIDPRGALMVHLSLKSVGETENRADGVLDALTEFMKDGLLVLPSHTWENVSANNPVMDVLYTPSCVGVCPELFRKRPGVVRSLHPTHSLAALGADAEAFVKGEELIRTPCGKGGAYYKLWERNAFILLIGVNFNCNTFIHGIEEWDNAEGTISEKLTDFRVIDRGGGRLYTPQYRHNAPLGSSTFSKLEIPAFGEGILKKVRFGNASARLVRAKPLRELTAGLLKTDPLYLASY